MAPRILHYLRARRTAIITQWEALLRVERVNGPLANPDTLAYLIPDSLEQVFTTLAKLSHDPFSRRAAKAPLPSCDCGNNPFLAYFVAGEQALVEGMVLLQAGLPLDERHQSDVGEIMLAVRRLARSEIDTFCSVCNHRGVASRCRHALAVR